MPVLEFDPQQRTLFAETLRDIANVGGGAMMFGSDNKHSIEKARRELGFEPKVDLRTGIRLAAEWFNAGGMEQPSVTAASQQAPLAGARK